MSSRFTEIFNFIIFNDFLYKDSEASILGSNNRKFPYSDEHFTGICWNYETMYNYWNWKFQISIEFLLFYLYIIEIEIITYSTIYYIIFRHYLFVSTCRIRILFEHLWELNWQNTPTEPWKLIARWLTNHQW